jgi:hypothetical protein
VRLSWEYDARWGGARGAAPTLFRDEEPLRVVRIVIAASEELAYDGVVSGQLCGTTD